MLARANPTWIGAAIASPKRSICPCARDRTASAVFVAGSHAPSHGNGARLANPRRHDRMGRNYLKGREGDRINAVMAAAGYNFSLLLRWLERLLRALIRALLAAPSRLETP